MKLIQLIGLLTLTALSAVSATTPSPDKLLTADTLMVFTAPDCTLIRSNWGRSPMAQLWADPSIRPFRDKFMAKVKSELVEPMERELGVKFADYYGLAQGQFTIALTRNNWDGSKDTEPGVLVLLDARQNSERLKTNLTSLRKKWVDSGKQIRTEKIRDIEFTAFVFTGDELGKTFEKAFPDPDEGLEKPNAAKTPKPKKPGRKVELFLGQSDSLLVLGNSVKDIEKILLRQSGGAVPALGEQAGFASSYNTLFRDASGYGWVNLKAFIEIVLKAMKKDGDDGGGDLMSGPKPEQIMTALGLNGLQTLAFSGRESTDGTLANFQVNIPESARRGLFKMLAFEAKDASPPPFVPAEAVKFTRLRLDLNKTFATLEAMLVEISPQMAGVIKLVVDNAGKDKDPAFDLRKSLFANLGDDIIAYEKAPKKQTLADLQSPPSIYLISSPKAEQLASAVKALGALMPAQNAKVKEREFLGRKVYALSLPAGMSMDGRPPVERTLHYAASGGYVALSIDVAMLEEYLRTSGANTKPLRETSGLAEAAQKAGGMGTGFFSYENQVETTRSGLEILKKESGTLANLFSGSPLGGRLGMEDDAKKFKEWVDFSLLPGFDKIAKYFYLVVSTGSINAEGMSLRVFAPTPPQLKK